MDESATLSAELLVASRPVATCIAASEEYDLDDAVVSCHCIAELGTVAVGRPQRLRSLSAIICAEVRCFGELASMLSRSGFVALASPTTMLFASVTFLVS